jgi:hypothetical protein
MKPVKITVYWFGDDASSRVVTAIYCKKEDLKFISMNLVRKGQMAINTFFSSLFMNEDL